MENVHSSNSPEQILYKDIKREGEPKRSLELESKEVIQMQFVEMEAKKIQVQLDEKKQFLDLQRSWAGHIKWQIWAVLAFQLAFVVFIGFNIGSFTNNIIRLPYMYLAVTFQNLANIIALGFVVAQFLFPNHTK